MIFDTTGRKLKKGQIVHVHMVPILAGKVMEIHEGGLVLPGNQGTTPPRVVVMLMPTEVQLQQLGAETFQALGTYIVAEGTADKEGKVIQMPVTGPQSS